MVAITFISHNKERHEVEGKVGNTVMETAIRNNVPGIEAECGGACSCATCHVYLEAPWYDKAGQPDEMEEDMLDFAIDVTPQSRLSCQIKVSNDLDGMEVHIPESQG